MRIKDEDLPVVFQAYLTALKNNDIFSYIADELDLSDEEMVRIYNDVEAEMERDNG